MSQPALSPRKILRALTLIALAGMIVSLALAWGLSPNLSGHGLRATYRPGSTQLDRTAFITANTEIYTGRPLSVTWTRYWYQSQSSRVTVRAPAHVAAQLDVDNTVVFERPMDQAQADDLAQVNLAEGLHPVRLVVTPPENAPVYFQAGLEWQTPLGWRLIPGAYLYPDAPDLNLARQAAQRELWSGQWGWVAALCAAAFLASALLELAGRHSFREVLGLLLCVGLALSLRLAVFYPLVTRPHYELLPVGHDQRTYQYEAEAMLQGHYPAGPFFIQPGISLTLGALYSLFGLQLRILPLLQTVSGALTTLLVLDFARRVFSPAAGWVAAALWITFPLAIFYETQLLTHGLEAQMGLLLVWLWLRALTDSDDGRWRWWTLLGFTLGLSAIWRPTFLALSPFMALSVLWPGRQRLVTKILWLASLTLATVIPITPVTWHNYQADGQFQLINGHTPTTLYLGNNRDSSGLALTTPAYWATTTLVGRGVTTYTRQTLAEIQADPERWVRLMVRKTALLLGNPEIVNNVDFAQDGTAVSGLLAILPLRFGALLALSLTGLILTLRRQLPRQVGVWLVLSYAVVQILSTIIHSSFSRFRAPMYAPLIVLAAGAVAGMLQQWHKQGWRELGFSAATLMGSSLFVALMPWVSDGVMRPPTIAQVPSAAQLANAPVGSALTLIGYDDAPLPTSPSERLVLNLYWHSQAPLSTNLYAGVQFFNSDGQPLGEQHFIGDLGTGGFPLYTTRQWKPGEIIRDPHDFELTTEAPLAAAFSVLIPSYEPASGQGGYIAIGPFSLAAAPNAPVPPTAHLVNAQVGTAQLVAYQMTWVKDELALTLFWQATGPMGEDGVVFVHVLDDAGQLVAGQDERPRNGLSSTQGWQPGEIIVDEHRLPLTATAPAEYRVAIGMYAAQTQIRLPVTDALGAPVQDNVLELDRLKP